MPVSRPATDRVVVPRQWLVRGFRKYAKRYFRKNFHTLRLSETSFPFPTSSEPVLIVLNHPSWWDPLIGVIISERFAGRVQYAAMEIAAFGQYGFFKLLGFVGVDTSRLSGAAEFLRTGQAILSEPGRVYWVTAQGRFADVRERPLNIRAGVGHLAARLREGWVVPLAFEYTYWNEKLPEALARLGEPISIAEHLGLDGKKWTALIETELTRTLDVLNAEAISRDPKRFTCVLSGRVGIGGVYDIWRRLKSWLKGKRFNPAHGREIEA